MGLVELIKSEETPEIVDYLFSLLPSLYVISLVLALVFTVLLEKALLFKKFKAIKEKAPTLNLEQFQISGIFIWFFILCFLLSYIEPEFFIKSDFFL